MALILFGEKSSGRAIGRQYLVQFKFPHTGLFVTYFIKSDSELAVHFSEKNFENLLECI